MPKYKLIKEINKVKEIIYFETNLTEAIKNLIDIEKSLQKPYQYKASLFEVNDSFERIILKKNLTISGDFDANYL